MGQLIDRLFRVFKSYSTESTKNYDSFVRSEDDELKRIIEELNNPNKNNSSKSNYSNTNSNSNSHKSNNSINNELLNSYKVLNLNVNASIDEIKNNYKKLMKEYHPDKVKDKQQQEIFKKKAQEINIAYNIIKKNRNFN